MSKEKLLQLEKENKYVFHGSPRGDIKSLEPRQGRHVPDWSSASETILDGNPAVSATPYVELAIFRAIINEGNISIDHTSGFGIRSDGKAEFRISPKEALECVKDKKGFVYVFYKSNFEPYRRDGIAPPNAMEWRSYKEVKPIEIVEVGFDDLPPAEEIEIVSA